MGRTVRTTSDTPVLYSTSATDNDFDKKDRVDEFRYPRIELPVHTQLCPVSRMDHIECEESKRADYYISTNETTTLALTSSIAVTYNGVEFVIIGNSSAPMPRNVARL